MLEYKSDILPDKKLEYRSILGGMLVQQQDYAPLDESQFKTVTEIDVPSSLRSSLIFAFKVAKYAKSNAIVIAKKEATIGIGAGQANRVDAVKHAIERAGQQVKGAILASDAFFPFDDSIKEARKAEIAAIIQPGGSIRDEEVIAACNKERIPMIFTQIRYFRH